MLTELRPAGSLAFFMILGLLSGTAVNAHSQSSSRLMLQMSEAKPESLTTDLALVDLLQVIDLDRNADGSLTWGELASSDQSILDFVSNGVRVTADDLRCRLDGMKADFSLIRYAETPYLRVRFDVWCPDDASAVDYRLRYGLFFDINPAHRALLQVAGASGSESIDSAHVMSPGSGAEVQLSTSLSSLSSISFLREGVRHILSGYDHLVFLLLLILPAAGTGPLRTRLLRIAVIVTAFTIAHSVTLAAATTGLIRLPSGPVEIGIAASIVLAAMVNVFRPAHRLGWKIAFAFGLVHGFGFAGALQEMSLQPGTVFVSLLAFNIGVEIGQLLVVALAVPVLALLALSARYRSVLVPSLSLAGAALGVAWTAARL